MAAGSFKFSTDPELEAKVRDIVQLYLNPPDRAVVLCVDEQSQIQALNPHPSRYRPCAILTRQAIHRAPKR